MTERDPLADSEAYMCPVCLGSFVESSDRPDVWVCLNCEQIAPLWYLRIMGIHECERDEQTTALERHRSVPHIEVPSGREWGRSRNLDDYAEVRAELQAGYEFVPNTLHAGYYADPAQFEAFRALPVEEQAARLGVPVEWLDDEGYFRVAEYEAEIVAFLRERFGRR